MSKIIISYNPDDTNAASSRLNDYLVSRFGAGIVTLGVDKLITTPASADSVLQNADSLVVMIGTKWESLGAYHSPDDLNRVAIASALKLNKTVIPVLVSGTPIPADLPSDISGLAQLSGLSFTAATVADDSNRIAEALIAAAAQASTPPANKTVPEQPTFMGQVPVGGNQPPQNPFGQQPPQQMQPYGYAPAKPPKPPVEPTSIPMLGEVTHFVRPLFERFGTLVMLMAPSALLFGIWFFLTSALGFSSSQFVTGLVSALWMAFALYVFFYLLSIAIPTLQLKTALITIIGLPVLTFLFILLDNNFLFTLLYLGGCGGLVSFGYSQRNRFIPGMGEPRLEAPAAITLSFDISGLISAMWMLWTYSGSFQAGNRNFAGLVAGALFGAAFAYVVYHALQKGTPQAYMPPLPTQQPPPPIQ
ncbi:MAG: hypothetical protein SH821_11090 [Phototrophicales bacterium]|nr:hypothetical protein [Phototrophicales bacterium]